jgi:hypothetical protein
LAHRAPQDSTTLRDTLSKIGQEAIYYLLSDRAVRVLADSYLNVFNRLPGRRHDVLRAWLQMDRRHLREVHPIPIVSGSARYSARQTRRVAVLGPAGMLPELAAGLGVSIIAAGL